MEIIAVVASLLIAFAVAAALGPVVIPVLTRIKAGQSIREEGPQSHQVKAGTPTMGGVMIIAAVIVASIVASLIGAKTVGLDMILMLLALVLCAGIGFIDDFIKVVKKRNLGLRAWQKLLLQVILAVVIALYQAKTSDAGTSIYIPIWKNYLDIGVLYVPFVAFVLVAMVNAVNLTDGLDGLAAGCTFIVAVFLTLMALVMGSLSCGIYSAALAGGCMGFLLYNRHPAKVFMGDTGSLALGGALAVAAIMMHIELILVLAGGIFVAEVCSVIIQVVSFKTRGKRVFRMSPIHHHFELGGWKETKVVKVFWLVTLAFCVISMIIM